MTQHNLQVPEEWIETALSEFREWAPAKEAMEKALQAILPKVRERLLNKQTLDGSPEAFVFRGIDLDESEVQRLLSSVFDSAFPPEDGP